MDLAGLERSGLMPKRSGVQLLNISLVMTGPFGLEDWSSALDGFGLARFLFRFRLGLSGAGVLRTAGSEGSEEVPGTEEEGSEEAFGFLPRVGREPSEAPGLRWATLQVFQLYV